MKASIALQKRRAFLFGAVAIAGTAAGCGSDIADPPPDSTPTPTPVPCPAYAVFPSFSITVLDAVTRAPIGSPTGTAIYEDLTTRYEFRYNAEFARLQLDVMPKFGLYSVVVRAPGYRDWVRDRVEFLPAPTPEVPCPKKVELVAELTRSS